MGKGFEGMAANDIHQKVLCSIKDSDHFDGCIDKIIASIVVDMFFHKNNGLQFFIDYYEVEREDFELFFKRPLIDYLGEGEYLKLKYQLEKESVFTGEEEYEGS